MNAGADWVGRLQQKHTFQRPRRVTRRRTLEVFCPMTRPPIGSNSLSRLVGLACIALSGCDAPLAPADIAGTYALVAYRGMALPQALGGDQFSSHTIIADTLELRRDGSGTWLQVRDLWYYDFPETLRLRWPTPVRLRRANDALALDEAYPCDDLADCAPPRSFTIRTSGEFLHLGRSPHVWSFRRVVP